MPPSTRFQKCLVTEEILPDPSKYDRRTDHVGAAPQKTGNPSKTADIPAVKGPKRLCYDVDKVDEGRRKRILANRKSAKCSRQRMLYKARAVKDDLARLEHENSALRDANATLQRRIMEAQAAIKRLNSSAASANASYSSELAMHPPRERVNVDFMLDALRQSASEAGIQQHFTTANHPHLFR
jgi:hypothetical protein